MSHKDKKPNQMLNMESVAQALAALRPGRKLCATVLSPMVVQQREFVALHKVPLMLVRTLDKTLGSIHQRGRWKAALCDREGLLMCHSIKMSAQI